ncbi:sugar ABC transporter ATP-binding protein [Diplocloster hominis]|uniref:sugar ABC transporter ATP-binding protein n=1 Tax=Diplocloster hominis TaxID=3079010 RepID=UPI0031BB6A54
MENEILLEMKNIRKEFPGVVAVNDVSMDIRKGEVHIIIGENGAGKSTLVKMMAGLYKIDGGVMLLNGLEYKPANVLDAQQNGVNIIHQELSMMQNRTVAQNVFVGREPVKGPLRMVDNKEMNRQCRELLEGLGIDIKPTAMVKDLSIAQQQMVEVAKAISTENKLLIMDEPTSSLTQKEIDNLFRITRQLKSQGTSIIYISHRMQELMEIGDRITVMRDGCYVGTRDADDIGMSELITMMVGRTIENVYNRTYNEPGKEMLRTEKLTGLRFRNVDIHVCQGEIVGFAGLVGAGRTELVKAIFGFDQAEGGKVFLEGNEINLPKHNCNRAVQKGMAMISENRKTEGLFINMSIKDNIVQACMFDKFRNGIVKKDVIKETARKGVKDLKVATTSIEKKVFNLSGGNQQKVVIAKWLATNSKLFIFDEPTRGIDVGAKSEIYGIMNELAKNGAAVIMISSDLLELLGLADRVYVMKDGEISGEVSHEENVFTQEYILSLGIEGGRAVEHQSSPAPKASPQDCEKGGKHAAG